MKKTFTIAIILLITVSVWAQAPEKMNYQAVLRNVNNQLVTNTSVGIQISILQTSTTGTAVYVETQTPTTNANGLVSLEIGTGTVVIGDFSTIDWANGPYFIKTETDPSGGTNYTITGISQLLSVPYALHAKTAENISGTITENDPVFGVSVASGITANDTTNWNNHTIDTDTHLNETQVDAYVANNGYITNEVDGDSTNEIQSISISNDSLYISESNAVPLTSLSNNGYSNMSLFNSPGTYTWQAPAGVKNIYLKIWSGSGGGGGYVGPYQLYQINWVLGNTSSYILVGAGGGGGGAGGYGEAIIHVIPGNTYTITVGGAGVGGAPNQDGTDGGDSSFDSYVVYGGQGGKKGDTLSTSTAGPKYIHNTGGIGGQGGYSNMTLNIVGNNGEDGIDAWIGLTYGGVSTPLHDGTGGTNGSANSYDISSKKITTGGKGDKAGSADYTTWNPMSGVNNIVTPPLTNSNQSGENGENGQIIIYY